MRQLVYERPEVLNHQPILFETAVSGKNKADCDLGDGKKGTLYLGVCLDLNLGLDLTKKGSTNPLGGSIGFGDKH